MVCHAHGYSNVSLFFAARACDRLWLSPAGEVGTVGIAGQMVYLKRLLDRFNVRADFLHMGKYKSYAETFTEDGPTEAARESLTSVLAFIRRTWLDGLAAARPREKLQYAVEHGPWSPEAALRDGLVDAVGYVSEARDEAKKLADVDGVETSFGLDARRDAADEISQLIQAIAGTRRSEGGKEHVVVLTAAGGINMEPDGMLGGGRHRRGTPRQDAAPAARRRRRQGRRAAHRLARRLRARERPALARPDAAARQEAADRLARRGRGQRRLLHGLRSAAESSPSAPPSSARSASSAARWCSAPRSINSG